MSELLQYAKQVNLTAIVVTHSRHQSLGSTQGSGKLYVGERAQ